MESERLTALAATGVALRAASPSLLHAIRGSLHDVAMLAALLQSPANRGARDADDDAKTAQRLRSINVQLDLLGRSVALLGAMMVWPRRDADAVCSTSSALPDVMRLLQDEAARQRIRFEHDLAALPAHVHADERSLQHALLACGAWIAQHAGERGVLRMVGGEDAHDALFDFDSPAPIAQADADTASELRLLAALVEAAGGRLSSAPGMRLAFPSAPARRAGRA
jgi:hypothetical protein